MKEKKRELYYDVLRIVSAFSIVFLHSAAQYWYTLDIYGRDWIVCNSYDAVSRFGVPVFVMISGALFLAPEYKVDIKRLYTHNILRLAVLYVVWSCAYGLWDCFRFTDITTVGFKVIVRKMIGSEYHLWFIPMIIGIYMLVPLLKTWVEHAAKKQIEYILILFAVFNIGFETIKALTVTDELHDILNILDVELITSYVGYFILGYYLAHIGIGPKLKKAFYIAFVPAVVCNAVLGNVLSHQRGEALAAIYDSYSIFTCIMAVAIFVFAKDKLQKDSYGKAGDFIIKEISAGTLGIYVLHIAVIEILEPLGIHSMMFSNIFAIPLLAVISFVICLLVAAVLRRIPFIGKYIC